ncbi:Protein HOL1 [Acrodontium crateriforme]|uniref:Protein HOL1 n=1 Tax=Acrodontium crateriforme TaxID=150365 RepID=A0AAQ3M660_9PEZI|nr:Protein HOL1 [Acrodontium crateriforme]
MSSNEPPPPPDGPIPGASRQKKVEWRTMLGTRSRNRGNHSSNGTSVSDLEQGTQIKRPSRWNMGILNDSETEEVPGSVLLLSKVSEFNEPLGMRNAPARTSASSLPSLTSSFRRRFPPRNEKKTTNDGKFVLEPQPHDSLNDPLNWKVWRRDAALLSLGFYCMVGGGMTPILAAGFNEVAADYNVSLPQVALTTGLYMMGLGLGSVILSPTAILFGKRPVYLAAAICFILSAIWCALSPNFASLVVARIFMGFAVSSVECLPSATVAEIYFLHEKAYRLGIYTLLLLGGKNLIPLVSAAIIQTLHWRWVFWIVAIVVGFGLILLFFFVPETFWDRAPVPHKHRRNSFSRSRTSLHLWRSPSNPPEGREPKDDEAKTIAQRRAEDKHARFAEPSDEDDRVEAEKVTEENSPAAPTIDARDVNVVVTSATPPEKMTNEKDVAPDIDTVQIPPPAITSPDYFSARGLPATPPNVRSTPTASSLPPLSPLTPGGPVNPYTRYYSDAPPKTFKEQLRPWSGRLTHDKWLRVAVRPFILFAYPSILWSTLVYSLSIGWLIVLSESVTTIFKSRDTYNFSSLQAGLVYISPFVGGILGTAVAGKLSDIVVRYLARKNGGIYEPEFRLVMAIPIAISTVIGLMGYGWSVEVHDAWIVPTIFFGIISFGCSLGSTTSITFAVDSYRQYAGEALVTLNFSKNILHGLVFSLFFNKWLDSEGSKDVFVAIGGIQLALLLTTIPMYIYGKRARMWTVRKNLMEKF